MYEHCPALEVLSDWRLKFWGLAEVRPGAHTGEPDRYHQLRASAQNQYSRHLSLYKAGVSSTGSVKLKSYNSKIAR